MQLFQGNKYPVIVGEGKGSALCTCWTSTEVLLKQKPELKSSFEIIGTLYSREGVSIIIRNLCLNPHIKTLYLLNDNPLSNTPYGREGWSLLKSVWSEGISTKSGIHAEISPDVFEKVRQNVKLVELNTNTGLNLVDVLPQTNTFSTDQYMMPVEFPAPRRDVLAQTPSEEIGWTVRGKDLTDAWLWVVDRILRYGQTKGTDFGNRQKELECVTWVIGKGTIEGLQIPEWPESTRMLIGLNHDSAGKYAQSLLDPVIPSGTSYTYGNRLVGQSINQIDSMIAVIKKSYDSRRAFAIVPVLEDQLHSSPPCLVYLQCLCSGENENRRVNLFATFRSHDIFRAAIPNAYALGGLLKTISDKTGIRAGNLCITSYSAHIYEEQWNDALMLLKCARWERKGSFRVEEDIDPRGTVLLSVNDGKIHLELKDRNTGASLYSHSAQGALPLMTEFCRLALLSSHNHTADIAMEAMKAEAALKSGIPYVQDRLIQVGSISLR